MPDEVEAQDLVAQVGAHGHASAGFGVVPIESGVMASRLGLARSLLGSLGCLCVAAIGSGLAQSGAVLLAWRLLEAAGYLGVVVTAPVLIVRSATGTHVGQAMALWSTFVPVGQARPPLSTAAAAPCP